MSQVTKLFHLPTLPSLLARPNLPLIHRDLSWLQFNERVLAEARPSSGNPLLDRVKFIAISASNLDEFFMIRLASMQKRLLRSRRDKLSSAEVERLRGVRSKVLENIASFGAKQNEVLEYVIPELDAYGIHVVKRCRERKEYLDLARETFDRQVLVNLKPPQSFRFSKVAELPNLGTGVFFRSGIWFEVPKQLPPVLAVESKSKKELFYFFLDDLLLTFLGAAFSFKGGALIVRLTRDSDFTLELENEEDPASIPDIVRKRLSSREAGVPVRVQYRGEVPRDFLERSMATLKLTPAQLFPAPGTLGLHGLWRVVKEAPGVAGDKPGLSYPALRHRLPRPFRRNADIFEALLRRDFLLHHPYDSFDALVEWLEAAARDKHVESIEQTIYRTDAGSRLVEALKTAAKTKRVRVAIELRARFDELNNLQLAEELQRAGVQITFGFGALKLHAKVALITRRTKDGVARYTHLSTGNYNATTARSYTDLAILTSNAEIGQDVRAFFDAVFKGEIPKTFRRLVQAPTQLHRRLHSHIRAETEAARAGKSTRIIVKVNAMVDDSVAAALYRAAQAGVQVDLIVRGACSLIPGVSGLSTNVRVVSVIDRFLEHSRVYYFESQRAMYLSSADWMPRNFYSRLEIAFPVLDARLFSYIETVLLPTYLNDNQKARELTPQGTWKRRTCPFGVPAIRAQSIFEAMAEDDYRGTPLTVRDKE